jgi:hypothetical protein
VSYYNAAIKDSKGLDMSMSQNRADHSTLDSEIITDRYGQGHNDLELRLISITLIKEDQ